MEILNVNNLESKTRTQIYELTIFVVGLCVLFLERNVAKG